MYSLFFNMVMVANIERSFRKLRVIKNYHQSTTFKSCYTLFSFNINRKKNTAINSILQKLYLK